MAFAAMVRTGYYNKGSTIRVQSVTKVLVAISKTIKPAAEQSPVYKAEKMYKVSVAWSIEG